MIRNLLLLITSLMIAGCHGESALSIRQGPTDGQLFVTNVSDRAILYSPKLFDHPLDIWNLSASAELRGREVAGFALFLVDGNGTRHLRCGSKDGPPPGKLIFLSLAPNESIRLEHAPIKKFTACGDAFENPVQWQVVHFHAVISKNVDLNKVETFSIVGESNLLDANPSIGLRRE